MAHPSQCNCNECATTSDMFNAIFKFDRLKLKYKDTDVIDDATNDKVNTSLYEHYSNGLNKAVSIAFNKDNELSDQLHANVSRFAAYKANYVKETLRYIDQQSDKTKEEKDAMKRAALRRFDEWGKTENTTAANRARTANQFEEYMSDRRRELFPNLRWTPSRATEPREEHRAFWDHVWAKDDPFWNTNMPGNLWNCNCDIEETDDDVTDNNSIDTPPIPRGLEGNPAKTGEVFTDNASYISKYKGSISTINIIGRDELRQYSKKFEPQTISSKIGKIAINRETLSEVSQANIWEKNYWLKLELAKNFKSYANNMEFVKAEEIDLTHNRPHTKAYKIKKKFVIMNKYTLNVNKVIFIVKIGQYPDGSNALYTIYQK